MELQGDERTQMLCLWPQAFTVRADAVQEMRSDLLQHRALQQEPLVQGGCERRDSAPQWHWRTDDEAVH